ncbi:MAG: hypothetical protein A3F35_02775 [Candidatus Woykebacteria bacterium RIFCSPHIGHO2_12_FULL_45_10]|uniref:Type 4 fimbrial biogenesis protein PilX N-terminal domain-containing protein n=1 Tax=Candidatus Woykebacteria bacterium RIFCSPHIGHO2_12_FULL_45_10 TaxID=1802603 RepID=A0A1G1WPF9_9BACT|nr:MAG: hypothetical protein A3F35_02775 [Candidatus Woykebacteria bacterium RIFCSPHIGHO2_12_FULL_45_10]
MNLPKNKRSQKGQILIIFLLVLVVGVAIVLSVASRSLTDIRTTTTSDESNRAYFAAEAGVESALKKISGTTGGEKNFSLDFTGVNQTTVNVAARPLKSAQDTLYASPSEVAKDDVFQLSLLDDFNNLKAPGAAAPNDYYNDGNPDTLTVFWGASGVVGTALEISLVYRDSAGTYGITKWGLDPSARANFCFDNAVITTGPLPLEPAGNLGIGLVYQYKATINVGNGNYGAGGFAAGTPCGDSNLSNIRQTVLLRVRPLYNTSSQPIGVKPASGRALPNQGFEVESTGSTLSGVTRKLRVIQPFPALPAIFDYVLFNGSSQPLTK